MNNKHEIKYKIAIFGWGGFCKTIMGVNYFWKGKANIISRLSDSIVLTINWFEIIMSDKDLFRRCASF